MHLPIGWGKIPFEEAFKVIGDDYKGCYLIENSIGVSERFLPETVEYLKAIF